MEVEEEVMVVAAAAPARARENAFSNKFVPMKLKIMNYYDFDSENLL